MLHHYNDIRERIAEEPRWWDENGVPRYCDFAPSQTADIYCEEVALVEIACQDCGTPFRVAMSRSPHEAFFGKPTASIAERIRDGSLHYGDPPNTGCCAAGATMNCDDRLVLEYWHRPDGRDWVRDPALEVSLTHFEPGASHVG